MTSPVQFCLCNPLICQLGWNDDVISYSFLPTAFDLNEIEIWDRSQCVRLVKTHLMICNKTYLGQSVILALCDLRSNIPSDLSGSLSIWIDPPWREKHDGAKINALSQISNNILTNNYRLEKRNFFSLTWPGRSTVYLNIGCPRIIRTFYNDIPKEGKGNLYFVFIQQHVQLIK